MTLPGILYPLIRYSGGVVVDPFMGSSKSWVNVSTLERYHDTYYRRGNPATLLRAIRLMQSVVADGRVYYTSDSIDVHYALTDGEPRVIPNPFSEDDAVMLAEGAEIIEGRRRREP